VKNVYRVIEVCKDSSRKENKTMKKLNRDEMKKVWNLIVLISSIVVILVTTLSILDDLEMIRFAVQDQTMTYAIIAMMIIPPVDGIVRRWNKR
jgi:hypothetical protein